MFACLDDRGRLFVAESSGLDLYAELQALTRRCRVSVLEDLDGDGVYERSRVFADNLVFPMGLVWREGKLYLADPPDLVTLEDTDGDGRADKRTVVLSGFGHSDNGSLHGLTFGPDGWLYMTMGEPDGFRLARGDGTVVTGTAGALLRCRPDGSGSEVVATGFVNLVEVVFLPEGSIVGTLNWYRLPEGGVRDALVHLVEDGHYPLHADLPVAPALFKGDELPPLALFPAVAHSGLALYRGRSFPEEMHGNLFSAQHNSRKIARHVLTPDGTTFRSVDSDFVTTPDPDVHFSDVLEDADGSLLIVDTGSWYTQHCPTGRIRQSPARGGIWRVRHPARARPEDPRGDSLPWAGVRVADLAARLGDARPAVRDRAGALVAGSGSEAIAPLTALLTRAEPLEAARQAVWALARIPDPRALVPLRTVAAERGHPLAPLAARALARRGDRLARPILEAMLATAEPGRRMAGAEALARCGTSESVAALARALVGEKDVFLQHALMVALSRLAPRPALEAALDDPDASVQRAALLLLDQPSVHALAPSAVLGRVTAADDALRATALRLLQGHAEWGEEALGFLRRLITQPELAGAEQSTLRDLVRTFQSSPAVVALVAEALAPARRDVSEARKALLLEGMAQSTARRFPPAWLKAVQEALRHPGAGVRAQAVRLLGQLELPGGDLELGRIADEPSESGSARLEALRVLARRPGRLGEARGAFLLGQLAPTNAPLSRLAAAEILAQSRPPATVLTAFIAAASDDAMIAPALVLAAASTPAIEPVVAGPLVAYLGRSIDLGWPLPEEALRRVAKALPSSERDRADGLLGRLAAQAAAQRKQLEESAVLLEGGDALRGERLFFAKAGCHACHRVGSRGGIVGPDLTRVGAVRSGQDLLESILLPSATFAQGYEPRTATTQDGESITGMLVWESAETLVLRDSSGAERRLGRDQITSVEPQKLSLMPEGLLQALGKGEARDLLAYLQNLR